MIPVLRSPPCRQSASSIGVRFARERPRCPPVFFRRAVMTRCTVSMSLIASPAEMLLIQGAWRRIAASNVCLPSSVSTTSCARRWCGLASNATNPSRCRSFAATSNANVPMRNATVWGNREFSSVAAYLLVAGVGTGVLAAMPGIIDFLTTVPPAARANATRHVVVSVLALLTFGVAWIVRGGIGGDVEAPALIVEAIGALLVGVSGFLGGSLVIRDGIGPHA